MTANGVRPVASGFIPSFFFTALDLRSLFA